MRIKYLPAALVAMMAAAPMAFANTISEGTIQSIDVANQTVTLSDGVQYVLRPEAHIDNLQVGEHVALSWKSLGNGKVVEYATQLDG